MAPKNDDYLDRVNQALLEEEEEEELTLPPAPPVKTDGRIRNADRSDVDLEEYGEEVAEPQSRTGIIMLLLLLAAAIFVGLALWLKNGGGLPW